MNKNRPLLTLLLGVSVFAAITTEMSVIGVMPQLVDRFHMTASQIGLLVSTFALVVAIAGPFMTLIAARVNRKSVILAALLVLTISNVVYALSDSFELTLVFRIIPATLHASLFAVAIAVAVQSSKPELKTKASAQVFLGVAIGLVLGVPITSFLAETMSLEVAFFFSGAMTLVAFLGIALIMPSMPVHEKPSIRSQLRILKRSGVWWNLAEVTFVLAAAFGIYSYFTVYLQKVSDASPTLTSVLLMIFGLFGILGNWLLTQLLHHNVRRTVLIYPVVFLAIYALIYFFGSNLVPMIILVAFWGIAHAGGMIVSQTWLSQETSDAPEFGDSLYISFSNVGITLGAGLGGIVISTLGTSQLPLVGAFFLVLAGAAISIKVLRDRATVDKPRDTVGNTQTRTFEDSERELIVR